MHMMDYRERKLYGAHGFYWSWWIFAISFSCLQLRDITTPRWLGLLLCKFNKHAWWLTVPLATPRPMYECKKCRKRIMEIEYEE